MKKQMRFSLIQLLVICCCNRVGSSSPLTTTNLEKDALLIVLPVTFGRPLIVDTDPLFRPRSTASQNTFSMGYYSYYSYSTLVHPTASPSKGGATRPTTKPISTTRPPSLSKPISSTKKPTTRPSLSKPISSTKIPTTPPSLSKPISTTRPTTPPSLPEPVSTKIPTTPPSLTEPVSTKKPTTPPFEFSTQVPSSRVISRPSSSSISMKPTLHPTLYNGTNYTASIQGNGSTPTQTSKLNLVPYIISATIASVVGFVSVTALILSRRNRIEPLLFSEDLEDDSLDTVSSA